MTYDGRVGLEPKASQLVAALQRSVLETPGATEPSVRKAALLGEQLPAPISTYVSKIEGESHHITDSDVADLLAAGYSEDAVFEITLAAAIGASARRLEAGLLALQASS